MPYGHQNTVWVEWCLGWFQKRWKRRELGKLLCVPSTTPGAAASPPIYYLPCWAGCAQLQIGIFLRISGMLFCLIRQFAIRGPKWEPCFATWSQPVRLNVPFPWFVWRSGADCWGYSVCLKLMLLNPLRSLPKIITRVSSKEPSLGLLRLARSFTWNLTWIFTRRPTFSEMLVKWILVGRKFGLLYIGYFCISEAELQ